MGNRFATLHHTDCEEGNEFWRNLMADLTRHEENQEENAFAFGSIGQRIGSTTNGPQSQERTRRRWRRERQPTKGNSKKLPSAPFASTHSSSRADIPVPKRAGWQFNSIKKRARKSRALFRFLFRVHFLSYWIRIEISLVKLGPKQYRLGSFSEFMHMLVANLLSGPFSGLFRSLF